MMKYFVLLIGMVSFLGVSDAMCQMETVTKDDSSVVYRNVDSKIKPKRIIDQSSSTLRKSQPTEKKEIIYDPKSKPNQVLKKENNKSNQL